MSIFKRGKKESLFNERNTSHTGIKFKIEAYDNGRRLLSEEYELLPNGRIKKMRKKMKTPPKHL